jgi:hypothetical protein
MSPEAPSAAELQQYPVVQAAFEAAWADSFPDDPALRHEEGGYIYYSPTTGDVTVRRELPGRRRELDLITPPELPSYFVVATYHTHPNPLALGWDPEPSPDDRRAADHCRVLWFVVSESGVYVAGPERRVGGLAGLPGYPI